MMLTEKTSVEFLESNGMTRMTSEGAKFGVPEKRNDKYTGLHWKTLFELTDEDEIAIDEYHEYKLKEMIKQTKP